MAYPSWKESNTQNRGIPSQSLAGTLVRDFNPNRSIWYLPDSFAAKSNPVHHKTPLNGEAQGNTGKLCNPNCRHMVDTGNWLGSLSKRGSCGRYLTF